MRSRTPTAAVIAAAVLLCLILCAVAANAVFVRGSVAALRTRADALPAIPDADTPGLLDGLGAQFNRYETGLSLSVSFPILDRVREQIAAARAYAVSGSDTDYAAALAVLREALNDLDRLERFSVRNIM